MYNKSRILNCDVMQVTKEDLLRNLKQGVLVTPNLDHMINLQRDREFYDCYRRAEWCVCDSHYLYLASLLVGLPLPETVSGADFFTQFYLYHKDDPDCRIFLLGAREGVGDVARKKINEKTKTLSPDPSPMIGRGEPFGIRDENGKESIEREREGENGIESKEREREGENGKEREREGIVIGNYAPPFGFENNPDEIENTIKVVNESGANVVLVGLGAPKQEKFIMRYKDRMPGVKIWMALGATIDFEAGNVKRAPRWVSRIGFEWLFRIIQEPKRLFRRYIGDFIFFWYLLKQVLGVYKNPWG